MRDFNPWGWLAAAIFAIIAYVAIPNQDQWRKTEKRFYHITKAETVSNQEAYEKALQINEEISKNLENYDGRMAYRHINELMRLETHLSYMLADDEKMDPNTQRTLFMIKRVKDFSVRERYGPGGMLRSNNRDKVMDDFHKAEKEDPNCWFDFKPVTFETNWTARWKLLLGSYLRTIPFSFFFFLCLLMRRDILLAELKQFFVARLVLVSATMPVSVWFFPGPDFRYQAYRSVCWLGYALVLVLSFGSINITKAQARKTTEDVESGDDAITLVKARVKPRFCTPRVTAEVWSDSSHDAQQLVYGNCGKLAFAWQSRQSHTGGKAVSAMFVGLRQQVGKWTFNFLASPVYTHGGNSFDKFAVTPHASLKTPRVSLLLLNKLVFPTDGKSVVSHRHVQIYRGPPFPKWLGLDFEELRNSSGSWLELMGGPLFFPGQASKRTPKWLKGFYIYPYYDKAVHSWDCRVGYSYSFFN